MVISIEEAKRFQDLLELSSHDMPYSFDRIFEAKGFFRKRLSKKKFKLLKRIDEQIRFILNDNEKVYFITWGVESSFAESCFLGWVMYYINRMAFIFTTQRILLIQISPRNKPLELRSQVRYQTIEKVGRTLFGHCKIRLRNGKKMIFIKVPKHDRKFMQTLITNLQADFKLLPTEKVGKENLCPYCYAVVQDFPKECPQCQKGFKSASKAAWLSFIFPGLGDFYLGHRGLAVFEMVIMAFIWLGFWVSVFSPDEGEEFKTLADVILATVMVFVMFHGVDALVTGHIGKKGLYPSAD